MIRRPPRSTLFPYTPLSRSLGMRKGFGGEPASAAPMNCRHISAGKVPPITRIPCTSYIGIAPSGYPTHTAATRSDRKSTRLNSSHANISYAVFCLKKKQSYPPHPLRRPLAHRYPLRGPILLLRCTDARIHTPQFRTRRPVDRDALVHHSPARITYA